MWSPDRRGLLGALTAAAALAGCGFAPAYAPGGTGSRLTGRVRIAPPSDTNGFNLVARLEDRLGRPQGAAYDLAWTVTTDTLESAVAPDGALLRYTLTGQADYTLTALADGAQIAAGRVRGMTAWSATGSTVASLAAEDDAAARLMVILADRIVARLLAAPLP